jgi:Photosynthetic reaction centre cytochrome C subunit
MEAFTEQLGVKCTFCHVLEQYEKDERPHRADARRMIKLVQDMKAKKADYFGPRTKEAVITCSMCAQGEGRARAFRTLVRFVPRRPIDRSGLWGERETAASGPSNLYYGCEIRHTYFRSPT